MTDVLLDQVRPWKPYLLDATYKWLIANGWAVHLTFKAYYPGVKAPLKYVSEDGVMLLTLTDSTVSNLLIDTVNDLITMRASFDGVEHDLVIPVESVWQMYSPENGHGPVFIVDEPTTQEALIAAKVDGKPNLTVVK
ncbi:ClpXP protease specificity-enhancing factor SspB [Pseudomonas aeruginosa]